MLETRYSRNKLIALCQHLWFSSYPVKLYYWYHHRKTMIWLRDQKENNPIFAKSMQDLAASTGVTTDEAAKTLSNCMGAFGGTVDCNNKHPLEK